MTRYAEIKDGVVVNIALATAAFAKSHGWIEAADASIGDMWDGNSFAPPPLLPEYVPESVTGSQGQLALLQTGNLTAVRYFIAGITDEAERLRAEIEFGRATWERSNPFLNSLWIDQMGRAETELDDLFRLASSL